MKVKGKKVFDVLKDSLNYGLDGNRFQHVYSFFEGKKLDEQSIKKFREELVQISKVFGELELGIIKNEKFVPVEFITAYKDPLNPEATFKLALVGVHMGFPHDYPAKEYLGKMIDLYIKDCDKTIKELENKPTPP